MLILDERHEMHVVLTSDDENALAAVTLGARVLQDVEQVASLDVSPPIDVGPAVGRPNVMAEAVAGGEPVSTHEHHASRGRRTRMRQPLRSIGACWLNCAPQCSRGSSDGRRAGREDPIRRTLYSKLP